MERLNKISFQGMIHPDLLNGGIIPSIFFFTLPLIISYVFQQLYNSVDIIIIAHFLGEDSLAAMGACTALYDLLIGFGLGFGNGLSIVAARSFGAGDQEKLKKITAASLIVTLMVTFFITVGTALFLHPVMVLLGTPQSIIEEAYSYISVITLFSGVLFAYNLFSGMLRAIGNSFTPLIFLIISSLLNILFDILFITQFDLGIQGAAFATVLAQAISALLTLFYITKAAKILVPLKSSFRGEKRIYRELTAQGLSMALMGAVVHTGTVILQYAINSFGPYIIAGHVCARKIFTLINIPIITLGLAMSTFVSQNLGANKIDRIKRGVRTSIFITFAWTGLLLILMPFFLKGLIVLISDSTKGELVDYACRYLYVMIPFFPILGALIITRNALQGLGEKLLPLISSIMEFFGKILFTAFLIPLMGTLGIILCEPLIWCVMTAQLLFVYIRHPVFKELK